MMGYKTILARLQAAVGGDGGYCRCVIEFIECVADEADAPSEDFMSEPVRQQGGLPCPKCGLPLRPGGISCIVVVRPNAEAEAAGR
jgi:hypothetical protein